MLNAVLYTSPSDLETSVFGAKELVGLVEVSTAAGTVPQARNVSITIVMQEESYLANIAFLLFSNASYNAMHCGSLRQSCNARVAMRSLEPLAAQRTPRPRTAMQEVLPAQALPQSPHEAEVVIFLYISHPKIHNRDPYGADASHYSVPFRAHGRPSQSALSVSIHLLTGNSSNRLDHRRALRPARPAAHSESCGSRPCFCSLISARVRKQLNLC